ncbi:DUF3769 domain-containing protein [Oculatella sp. LEGE 06141]|uniref:DUF3769 domain-containing protein n=1 Tax=Oculatella sp. LEGE 06141 TaxID=1828648 RepID=UPI00187E9EF0|nr:DUF3769 domain-containing protein [Oculatella sp. LEGE 06141]MBE9179770.1 DUF3769 domain-containing protein [Oculatella sp. LEGE 06141]
MPYPVPPPTPPAIVNVLPPEDLSHSATSSSVSAPVTSVQSVSQPTAIAPPDGAAVGAAPSPVCPPERFPANCLSSSTLLSGITSGADTSGADTLGMPIEMGLPEQPDELIPVRYGLTRVESDWGGSPQAPPTRIAPTQTSTQTTTTQAATTQTAPQAGAAMSLMGIPVVAQVRDAQSQRVPNLPELEPASPQLPGTQPPPVLPSPEIRNPPESQPGLELPDPLDSPTVPPDQPLPVEENAPTLENEEEPTETDDRSRPGSAAPNLDEGGEVLTIPESGSPDPDLAEPASEGAAPPDPATPPTNPAEVVPIDPSGTGGVIELTADRQQYDTIRQVFVAEGNVEMRFRGAVLNSEFLRVNLPNRVAVAEGDAILVRGEQVLQGDRFEYNFVRNEGAIFNARGEVFIPSAGADLTPSLPTDVSADARTQQILTDRIAAEQPPVQATPTGSGLDIGVGSGPGVESGFSGEINRIRFEAERLDFFPGGWEASNVRLTNDPFSPPELELRSPEVTFTEESPTRSVIRARRPRVVFDQGFSLPLFRNRFVIDRRERDPGLVQFGFDNEDRGGLFAERTFDVLSNPIARFSLTPQFYIQRALTDSGGNIFDPSNFGVRAEFDARLDQRTSITGSAVVTDFSPEEFSEELRASVRAQRRIGTHRLAAEYSYRDRLFNGSLGFQNVQSSLGIVLTSPSILLGNTGIGLSYQVGAQYITANTDREDLLPEPPRDNNRASLGRFQASAALNRGFLLWQGTPLPATPTEGLRYSPFPIVPYLQLFSGVRGVYNAYTNGENQTTLTGSIGLQGQFGHFSRNFFDYTAFNVTYSQTAKAGDSPFFFDRVEDRRVISAGLVQQIYGPLRAGFQTSLNLDRSREIDTEYILEYSRRTYAITLRFNPVREVGSLRLRINDFNWTGNPGRFSGADSGTAGGVQRLDN